MLIWGVIDGMCVRVQTPRTAEERDDMYSKLKKWYVTPVIFIMDINGFVCYASWGYIGNMNDTQWSQGAIDQVRPTHPYSRL